MRISWNLVLSQVRDVPRYAAGLVTYEKSDKLLWIRLLHQHIQSSGTLVAAVRAQCREDSKVSAYE